MWRCLRFIDNYKGKRPIDVKDTYKLLDKIRFTIVSNIGSDIIEDIFVPAGEDIDHKKNYLVGILFIKYDEKYDHPMLNVLQSNRITLSSIVTEDQVESIRANSRNLNLSQAQKLRFSVGDSVQIINGDYKDMIGYVSNVNASVIDVNIQIFGRDHIVSLDSSMLSKLKY